MSEDIKLEYTLELKPGEATPNFKLSPADKEILMQLHDSRGWKLYSKMLSIYQDGLLKSLMALEDSVKIHKALGTVAGVLFAQNQLGLQVNHFKKQREAEAKRVANEVNV